MSTHPSRFDPSKGYARVEYVPGRADHSYDANDAQRLLEHRIKGVADGLLKDGGVVSGADIAVDPETGFVRAAAGKVYAAGQVHDVPARTMTIPVDRTVTVGLCVSSVIVSYEDDLDLRGRETGTRAFGEPGADRLKITASWTWDGASPACDGAFYGVYRVVNGSVLTQDPPVAIVDDRLARYDREANGHYIVSGWTVRALGYDAAHRMQAYSISEGVINVWGYKSDRKTALRVTVLEEPETNRIAAEPHTISAGGGSKRIATNHGPISTLRSVTLLRQKTVNLTHGPYAGVIDPLPDTAISALISITQGAVTYAQGADYVLTGDGVDWRQVGTQEPAPGSTYAVTYQYLVTGAPDAHDTTSVTVSDVVPGSMLLIDYDWSLPRIDALAADRDGLTHYIKGQSALYSPVPPSVPRDWLAIAYITNSWGNTPAVKNVGTRAVHNTVLEVHSSLLVDLYDLVAQERLKRSMDSSQPTTKRGLFVDNFSSDAMRDQGLAQTAAIVGGTLRLPITATVEQRTIAVSPILLAWTEELLIDQPMVTSSMKVNPYQSFSPMPAKVSIDPAIDTWVAFASSWASPLTNVIENFQTVWGNGVGGTAITASSTQVQTLRNDTVAAATIRPTDVLFDIEGFGVGEALVSVTFDGIPVAPRIDPTSQAPLIGNAQGRLQGIFTIPANLPVGAKHVAFLGAGGTTGNATYVGSGQISTQIMRLVTNATLTTTTVQSIDPLAETFALAQPRHIAAVDIWFAAVGNRATPCVVQIREVQLGLPTSTAIAEARLDMHAVQPGQWTHVSFPAPPPTVAGAEYAIVVLTDDADHALGIAALGDFDTAQQRFVTAQPYQVGVLLSSSNARTWTPHNGADLAFRVYGARFSETQKIAPLIQPVALVNCTDLMINVPVDDTYVNAHALIKITRADGSVLYSVPGQPVIFATPVTEQVTVAVVAKGTATESPVIYPWMQIIQGTIQPTGTYLSRAMPAGNATLPMNAVVTFDGIFPGNVAPVVEAGQDGAWAAMTLHSVTPLGDGWQERNYVLENYTRSDARIRLTINGSSSNRPQIRELRANVTPNPINIITGQ